MSSSDPPSTMHTFEADLPRKQKVILVMDMVESVRLMAANETDVIQRWRQFVHQATDGVLPTHGGRLVKSLGDGIMVEFDDARQAVGAALQLHRSMNSGNAGLPPEQQMLMRAGIHDSHVYVDSIDIYGAGVNLAARVATLAGPGEIVVTAPVRDGLTDGLDAELEDLGECYLKHVEEPVRVYRAGPAGPRPVVTPQREYAATLQPTIAVIPFEARSNEPEHFAIGELIADGVIGQLSRTADLRVISRLSSTAFRGRQASVADIETQLGATYVLSGSYIASGGKLLISAELADARSNQVAWAERLSGDVGDLLQIDSELCHRIAAAAHSAVLNTEVQKALSKPLPTLESCSLLLGGIALMHRSSAREFERGRAVLDALVERHNKVAAIRAWLAKWYVMRIMRGLSDSPARDTRLALEQTERALDIEPDHALTLAVQGHAYCQLSGEFDKAHDCLDRAVAANPNEPMAWLFKSVLSTMWGSSAKSVDEAEHSCALSPLDPLKYYFDLFLAAALLADHDHAKAMFYAKRSLRGNRTHAPTLRMLLTAQVESGLMDDAHVTLKQLFQETPMLTVSNYLAFGSAASSTRQRCAAAMRALGVPE
ncbi:MAG TPA: adenylate/guanylate cyclase domain-containing protein [Burkholderiaceae bacterium]|nr:adenylate/guanylate cyclase domain-containing protein [Burkholderiaceae bacterium]